MSNKDANTPSRDDSQSPCIIDRLDACIGRMIEDGENPAGIYLTDADYKQFAAEHTRVWRSATGSVALLWPMAHDDVPLIAEKLIPKFEAIPARQSLPEPRCSAIYSTTGRKYPVDLP